MQANGMRLNIVRVCVRKIDRVSENIMRCRMLRLLINPALYLAFVELNPCGIAFELNTSIIFHVPHLKLIALKIPIFDFNISTCIIIGASAIV